jgi:hypothetical protein
MSLDYLGSLSVGGVAPSVQVAVDASLPNLLAQQTGLLAAQADLTAHPPTIAGNLAIAQQIVASLQAQIALGVEVPGLGLQLASIAAALGAIAGQITALSNFADALAAVGLHSYHYAGPVNGLGPALAAELAGGLPGGGPVDASDALIIATSVPAAWSALSVILKTS